jgi:hypothetical protein
MQFFGTQSDSFVWCGNFAMVLNLRRESFRNAVECVIYFIDALRALRIRTCPVSRQTFPGPTRFRPLTFSCISFVTSSENFSSQGFPSLDADPSRRCRIWRRACSLAGG